MTSGLWLLVVVVQSVLGTFPPVDNPPPIPSQSVRAVRQYFVQEDINEEPPLPNVRDGPISVDSSNDQGWFIQERQIADPESLTSREERIFDRFFQNGEPAIGPVATPMPDETFLAESSGGIAKVNLNDGTNPGSQGIWIISRATDNDQYVPEGWVQVPNERIVEVVNQGPDSSVATDIVKSYSAPLPQIQEKTEFSPVFQGNVAQQIVFRKNTPIVSVSNQPVVAEIPSVKPVVGPQPPVFKQVIQPQVVKEAFPAPPPSVAQTVPVKKSFALPPPPAPPVKGGATSPKVISSVNPGPNVLLTDKSGLLQQMRHIWVPTSSRTGRFVTIPVSSSGKVTGKVLPQDGSPVSVSDTWVLNTEGLMPSFEQQKSFAPPAVFQPGKSDVAVVQVDQPQTVRVVESPKNAAVVKSFNAPVDIWPARNDIQTAKVLDKSVVSGPAVPLYQQKSNTFFSGKTVLPPQPQVVAQKSIVSTPNIYSPPPQLNAQVLSFINGKPCPIHPQHSVAVPKSSILVPPPISRIVTTQTKQPLTRIIRVNRVPTGSYYLLNSQARPNIVVIPSRSVVQQSKTGMLRFQNKAFNLPLQPVQSKQYIPTLKQVGIPAQQVVASKSPQRLVIYSLPQQLKSPILPTKSTSQLVYPALQRYRYAYPLNGYVKPSPLQFAAPIYPKASPLKAKKSKKNEFSSSSESSSSEESEEKKKEESSESGENSKESEEKVEGKPEGEVEKEGSEESKEESGESKEAAESQVHPNLMTNVVLHK